MPRASRRYRFVSAVPGVLALAALGSTPTLAGCASRRAQEDGTERPRRVRMSHAGRVAYGRPATCPDGAVDVFGDGRPGPDDLRCSYADTAGGELVRVTGRVLHQAQGGVLGDEMSGVTVLVHRVDKAGVAGPVIARATTDAQGKFSVGAVLRAGEYLLVLPGASGGPPRAARRFEVDQGARQVDRIDLLVPAG